MIFREQVGENAVGDTSVLQHIGNPRWCTQVIFQHIVRAVMITDQVDSGDMGIDIKGHIHVHHLPYEIGTGIDQFCRNNPVFNNELLVIDIFQENIQCFQPLFDPFFNMFPLGGFEDTGNDVEGEDFFNAFPAAVNRERDALAHEQFFGQLIFMRHFIG